MLRPAPLLLVILVASAGLVQLASPVSPGESGPAAAKAEHHAKIRKAKKHPKMPGGNLPTLSKLGLAGKHAGYHQQQKAVPEPPSPTSEVRTAQNQLQVDGTDQIEAAATTEQVSSQYDGDDDTDRCHHAYVDQAACLAAAQCAWCSATGISSGCYDRNNAAKMSQDSEELKCSTHLDTADPPQTRYGGMTRGPLKVAMLVWGESYRAWNDGSAKPTGPPGRRIVPCAVEAKSEQLGATQSLLEKVIRPLETAKSTVHVYSVQKQCPSTTLNMELEKIFGERLVASTLGSAKDGPADSIRKVLDLFKSSRAKQPDYDVVMLTRHDMMFKLSIGKWPADPASFMMASACNARQTLLECANDAVQIMPLSVFDLFDQAVGRDNCFSRWSVDQGGERDCVSTVLHGLSGDTSRVGTAWDWVPPQCADAENDYARLVPARTCAVAAASPATNVSAHSNVTGASEDPKQPKADGSPLGLDQELRGLAPEQPLWGFSEEAVPTPPDRGRHVAVCVVGKITASNITAPPLLDRVVDVLNGDLFVDTLSGCDRRAVEAYNQTGRLQGVRVAEASADGHGPYVEALAAGDPDKVRAWRETVALGRQEQDAFFSDENIWRHVHLYGCKLLVEREEKRRGQKYQKVLVTRSDMEYVIIHPPKAALDEVDEAATWFTSPAISNRGLCDHYMFGPRDKMIMYMGSVASVVRGDPLGKAVMKSGSAALKNAEVRLKAAADYLGMKALEVPDFGHVLQAHLDLEGNPGLTSVDTVSAARFGHWISRCGWSKSFVAWFNTAALDEVDYATDWDNKMEECTSVRKKSAPFEQHTWSSDLARAQLWTGNEGMVAAVSGRPVVPAADVPAADPYGITMVDAGNA